MTPADILTRIATLPEPVRLALLAVEGPGWHVAPDSPMFEVRRCRFCHGLGGHRFSCLDRDQYKVRRIKVTATGTKDVST